MKRVIDFLLFLVGIRRKKKRSQSFKPLVTVIIPAYNEEKTIGDTILSVKSQSYPIKEIIVIDDCSSDRTGEIAKALDVKVVRTPKNSGTKSKAQNFGLRFVETDLVATVDADTILDSKAMELVVSALGDQEILSVCGFVIPQKIRTFWEKCRLVQYLYYIGLNKSAQDHWGIPLVSSGCFSVFNTKILKEMGGFPEGTIVEDMALTWRAHLEKKEIKFVPQAVCYPKDPSNWKQYKSQVMRWDRGFLQCVGKYRLSLIKNPRLAFFVFLYLLSGFIQPLFLGFFIWYLAWFFSTNAYQGEMLFVLPFFGFSLEVLIVFFIILIAGIRYNHLKLALISFPYYWLMAPVDTYLFLSAVCQEWIFGKKLENWEKGH